MVKISVVCFILINMVHGLLQDVVPVLMRDEGVLTTIVESKTNPFEKVSHEVLEKILDRAESVSQCLLFFIEENFSIEDISLKDKGGMVLNNIKEKFLANHIKLFLGVIDPYTYLTTRYPVSKNNIVIVNKNSRVITLRADQKYFYVFFEDDLKDSRIDRLKQHDSLMDKVFYELTQAVEGPVIAFYTGKECSLEQYEHTRMRASATFTVTTVAKEATPMSTDVPFQFNDVADCGDVTMEFDECKVIAPNVFEMLIAPVKCDKHIEGDSSWSYYIVMQSKSTMIKDNEDYNLKFTFTYQDSTIKSKGWILKKIVYFCGDNEQTTRLVNASVSWDTAFVSEGNLTFIPKRTSAINPMLSIKSFRIVLTYNLRKDITSPGYYQTDINKFRKVDYGKPRAVDHEYHDDDAILVTPPARGIVRDYVKDDDDGEVGQEGGGGEGKGESNDKRGNKKVKKNMYVNIPLMTSLFVTWIMLTILAYGVSMLMSIRTNSMYDNITVKPLYGKDAVHE